MGTSLQADLEPRWSDKAGLFHGENSALRLYSDKTVATLSNTHLIISYL